MIGNINPANKVDKIHSSAWDSYMNGECYGREVYKGVLNWFVTERERER